MHSLQARLGASFLWTCLQRTSFLCSTVFTDDVTEILSSSRFRVTIEMLKPEKPDPATTLKGLEYADVPGLSKKEYKLNFYAHKEGTFSAKVR